MRLLPLLPLLAACTRLPIGPAQKDTAESVPPVPEDTGPIDTVENGCEMGIRPAMAVNEVLASNLEGLQDADGDSPDWIEVVNLDPSPVDLLGWTLVNREGQRWTFPSMVLEPGAIALVIASGKDRIDAEIHASFAIGAEDPEIALEAPDGCTVDRADPGRLYGDISFGRAGADTWGYFLEPTPGLPNTTASRPGFVPTPILSPEPGFYRAPITAGISDFYPEATLRCTLDGAEPTLDSPICDAPLALDARSQPVVVRARAWMDGLWPSRVATATYSQSPSILDDDLIVVSLVVDPFDLWDELTGIYAFGPNDYEPHYPYFGANFWEDWERPVHIQAWEPDGRMVLDQDAGIKINGGYTRAFEQKSFRIIARSAYGPQSLAYRFFPYEDIDEYAKIVLEGAGDWCPTHTENAIVDRVFRDAQDVRFPTIDSQAWEPAVVYLNGAFWGLYAFREKEDEDYIAAHHGADPDNLDRIECTADGTDDWWRLNQGTWDAFDEMNAFATQADLSEPQAWQRFQGMAEIDNLATYLIAQAWFGNADFWYNNLRLWRERTDPGPFRWMVFDLGHGWTSPSYNQFGTSVTWSGPGLPVADALENDAFRVLLANQASDFLNTNLASESVLARLDEMHARIEPVMPEQYERWCGQPVGSWYDSVDYARSFVQERPTYLRQQVRQGLAIDGTARLHLEAEPAGSGSFHLTVVDVEAPFTGEFYTGIPITVTAVPAPGWRFAGWSDADLGNQATTILALKDDRRITASFQ